MPEKSPTVTISATVNNQAAGASLDILDKQALFTSVSVVQSVVYLGSLQNLYTAELSILSGSGEGSLPAAVDPAQGSTDSEIFTVPSSLVKASLANFPNEEIAKMISFTASDNNEYLLLAAKTSGKVIRLDPSMAGGDPTDVVTGLNEPTALVLDSITGNLLVAEKDKITNVARSTLESGLTSSAVSLAVSPAGSGAELFPAEEPEGVAVDHCTGNVYFSRRAAGEILKYVRSDGTFVTILSNLIEPTQILPFYRAGVSCPNSFQLLVVEAGRNQIRLLRPVRGTANIWLESPQGKDLALLPADSPFATAQSVLVAEASDEGSPQQEGGGFVVNVVKTEGLYDPRPDNAPGPQDVLGPVVISDPNLEAVIREALGLDATTPITTDLAEGLTSLQAPQNGISSLEGLQDFINLQTLELDGNNISDITPLADLTQLTSLHLGRVTTEAAFGNSVSDIGPLENLTNLEFLFLDSNQIGDISKLANLTQLKQLGLSSNSISDISTVANLTGLTFLEIGFNQVSDLTPVASLTNLTTMAASFNMISDLTPLSGLTGLTVIAMDENSVADLSPLTPLTHLSFLSLVGNPIDNISALVANSGLGADDLIRLLGNPLSVDDCGDLTTLISRGAIVEHDVPCEP